MSGQISVSKNARRSPSQAFFGAFFVLYRWCIKLSQNQTMQWFLFSDKPNCYLQAKGHLKHQNYLASCLYSNHFKSHSEKRVEIQNHIWTIQQWWFTWWWQFLMYVIMIFEIWASYGLKLAIFGVKKSQIQFLKQMNE